jgi:hypothetical protein
MTLTKEAEMGKIADTETVVHRESYKTASKTITRECSNIGAKM